MQILTVVYTADIPQLLLQAESIKKFWKDNKHWTIVIEDPRPNACLAACDIIKQSLVGWNIEVVVPVSQLSAPGWIRQQLFKLWYTAQSVDDWVLIIDCKNFLIRPMDQQSLVNDNTVLHLPLFSKNEFTIFTNSAAKEKLKITEDVPLSSCMNPCAWNSAEARLLIKELDLTLDTWVEGGATEFTLYWVRTYNKFVYKEKQFATGFWDEIADKKFAKEIALAATKDDNFLIWVHHRYVDNIELRELTNFVLSQIGISQNYLDRWNEQYQQILLNDESLIKQDRSKWKDLLK
jgi:hypothetical protein